MVLTKEKPAFTRKQDTSDRDLSYRFFLRSPSGKQWQRIGIRRRSGVATALFSIFSRNSIGVGEIPDLKLLIDWCKKCGLSIVQLLPLNDVGFHFRPYDADSSFALDPMYLSLKDLKGITLDAFQGEIEILRRQFPGGGDRVNYEVKGEKLRVLWNIFLLAIQRKNERFEAFRATAKYWLGDYVLFRVLKQVHHQKSWMIWPECYQDRDREALEEFRKRHRRAILFHEWQQWQLYEQMKAVRQYARENGVFLMGDLPLLVSADSADVWAHRRYFDLSRFSGAPPDAYYVQGQRWGMPIYKWSEIEKDRYEYLKQKLKYAEEFYDLYRIDHAVGLFRIWAIPQTEPADNYGLNGSFEPPNESDWERNGERLLELILASSTMLPCAEDLGTIPVCTFDVLKRLCLAGMDVQRWQKDPQKNYSFLLPQDFRKNSIALLSNHDMSSFRGWWEFEASTVDELAFERACKKANLSISATKRKLFDLGRSRYDRLRWKSNVKDVKTLCEQLGLDESEAAEFISLYHHSFDEQGKYWRFLSMKGEPVQKCSPKLVEYALRKVNTSASIFSIQFLHDWLSLNPAFKVDSWKFRINFPATVCDENWSVTMPLSLELMIGLKINAKIKKINEDAGRT